MSVRFTTPGTSLTSEGSPNRISATMRVAARREAKQNEIYDQDISSLGNRTSSSTQRDSALNLSRLETRAGVDSFPSLGF